MSIRERIADLEHKQWIKWSQAVGGEVAPDRLARWQKLWAPYQDLPEDVKEQDKEWADIVLNYLKAEIENLKINPPSRVNPILISKQQAEVFALGYKRALEHIIGLLNE